MKIAQNPEIRKRPVNLTLNRDLVTQVRALTDNLSAVVELLLTDYVERERQQRMAMIKTVEATVTAWNEFNVKHGSFADEYSSL